ncbi:ester cyclase [Frankia sp. AgKG'84/4]|uniref:ester cyclase n=1 Tax=Frankia sp. AgKG'84/4 TaxID=573490 RepID=UPI0020100975|nr:ester cyclase [Frankia sp. AgKG'84/4]MCL9794458.1 ester cyclase [Frankia sp. AgKG'84/4]
MATAALDTHDELVRNLLELWFTPPTGATDLDFGFRRIFADPVRVNGTPIPVAALADQVRGLHTAYEGLVAEVSLQVPTARGVALAFEMRGLHVGPLPTPIGTLQATGRMVRVPTMEVLTIEDGRITALHVIADELVLLRDLGALPSAPQAQC